MTTKTFEVRDNMTFIPVLAVRLEPGCTEDQYLLARAGYGNTMKEQSVYVVLWRLGGGEAHYNLFQKRKHCGFSIVMNFLVLQQEISV